MTERFARLTHNNVPANTVICGSQVATSDENLTTIKYGKNLKDNGLMQQGMLNNLAAVTTTTSAMSFTSHIAMANASIRNALGDIGNKIVPSNMNKQPAGKDNLMPTKTTTSEQYFGLEGGTKQLLVAKSSAIVKLQEPIVQQQQQLVAAKKVAVTAQVSSNNSCIMIDDVELHDRSDECIIVEESISDIDEFDTDNTQLVAEYVKDIYTYLNKIEKQYRVSSSFLEGKIVTTKMRAVLIDWLIQVHLKFHLLQETLYLCVQIIDAYLQAQNVPKMQLQLVGVTAMFVASKYEEMYVPAIDDFVYMTDNTYSKSEIRQMEISILKTLNFMFCKPLPLHFLRRFSKAGQADPKQHTLAKFFMELSLHDAEFSSMDPSYLAACSLCLSFKLLNATDWNRTLVYYTTYTLTSLLPGIQKIAKLVLKSMDHEYKYKAATNKYGASKFMRISMLPELSSKCLKDAAAGSFGAFNAKA